MKKYIYKGVSREKILSTYEAVKNGFSVIHVLIGMAIIDSQDAIDEIEDAGKRRFLVSKHLNAYEARANKYKDDMRSMLEENAWYLLQDYVNMSFKTIEDKVTMLKIACKSYLDKLKMKDSYLLAKCETAFLLWQVAIDTYDAYFEKFKKICGVDFSKEFAYADMEGCLHAWANMIDELAKKAKVNFGNDDNCLACWEAIQNTLDDTKTFVLGAKEALHLNKANYADKVSEIDKDC